MKKIISIVVLALILSHASALAWEEIQGPKFDPAILSGLYKELHGNGYIVMLWADSGPSSTFVPTNAKFSGVWTQKEGPRFYLGHVVIYTQDLGVGYLHCFYYTSGSKLTISYQPK